MTGLEVPLLQNNLNYPNKWIFCWSFNFGIFKHVQECEPLLWPTVPICLGSSYSLRFLTNNSILMTRLNSSCLNALTDFTHCWLWIHLISWNDSEKLSVRSLFKSSRPEVFCKKKPATLLKKSLAQVFSSGICEISQNTYFSPNTSVGCFYFL